jgi:UDP-N-acetylglucosamine 2-epimerase (non-hydrolysing)
MFERLFEGIAVIAEDLPLVFPIHPRTRRVLESSPAAAALIARKRLQVIDPLGYLDFLGLTDSSSVVLTDSGGIQEETTMLGVPCLTLRENTERPVTITHGTNRLIGTDPARLVAAWRELLAAPVEQRTPPLWDGKSAERIVAVIREFAGR